MSPSFPHKQKEKDGLEQGKEIKQEGRDRDPNRMEFLLAVIKCSGINQGS